MNIEQTKKYWRGLNPDEKMKIMMMMMIIIYDLADIIP